MKKVLKWVLIVLVVAGVSAVVVANYSLIFSRIVAGEIFAVERVTEPAAVIGGTPLNPNQMYSFAIAIRDREGAIHTASSEDRQWAVAHKGLCVEARYYPYPPWNFEKAGTYFNARLIKLMDCPKSTDATPNP